MGEAYNFLNSSDLKRRRSAPVEENFYNVCVYVFHSVVVVSVYTLVAVKQRTIH